MTVTAYFGRTAVQYTVTLNVDTPAYGSVSPSSLQVDYKTPITLSGNVLSIGDTEIVFTPASPT